MSQGPGLPKLKYETRLTLLCLAGGLPAVAVAVALLWTGDFRGRTQWTGTAFILAVWCACAFLLREQVIRPLQTLSNLLAGLHEGDFSFRARGARPDDYLG